MLVREAGPEDAEAIAAARVRSWQAAYAHVFPEEALGRLDVSSVAAFWRERIATGDRVLVTEDGSGFVSVGPSRDALDEGELYAIYVDPERWGAGRGRALMHAAIEALREAGFSEAILWVLDDNPRARRFYEAAGWRLDGAEKPDEFFGVEIREVRYRISLR